MGGYAVQVAALLRPTLVRRLIVAGSGPGRVPGMPAAPDKVGQVLGKPEYSDEDFQYLFFPETDEGRQAGLATLRRLDTRLRPPPPSALPSARSAPACGIGWQS
jgi:pimeloyl-ACP methyl ester carboxylesterase